MRYPYPAYRQDLPVIYRSDETLIIIDTPYPYPVKALPMKAFLTLILCFFSGTTLFAQKNTTGQLKLMEARCDSLIKHDRFDALTVLARQALRITPDNDWYHQALFSFYIGRSYELPVNYDSAIYYLERSQAFARKAKDAALLSRPLRGLVFAYYSSGEEVKKDKVAKELEIIADTTSNELLRVNNNATLANHYASKGIHEKQLVCLLEDLTYYKKQLKKGKDIDDSKSNISIDLIKLAELYTTSLGQPEKSIAYLAEARPYIAAENRGSIIFLLQAFDRCLARFR
jgi:tetratricopeptide (TPR) repeat protein